MLCGSLLGRVRVIPRKSRCAARRLRQRAPLVQAFDGMAIALCLHDAVRARADYATGWLSNVGCGVGLDTSRAGCADPRGDALALPFRDEVFDTVLCNQVLEHVAEPRLLLGEIVYVLELGARCC